MSGHVRRRKALRRLWLANGGDVSAAMRAWTGHTTARMASLLGVSRQSVEQCLRPGAQERAYKHIRRALEAEYKLPAHTLDRMLP